MEKAEESQDDGSKPFACHICLDTACEPIVTGRNSFFLFQSNLFSLWTFVLLALHISGILIENIFCHRFSLSNHLVDRNAWR